MTDQPHNFSTDEAASILGNSSPPNSKKMRSKDTHMEPLFRNVEISLAGKYHINTSNHQYWISKGKLNPEIDYIYDGMPILSEDGINHTPRIILDSLTIEIYNSFASALWSFIYAVQLLVEFNIEKGLYAGETPSWPRRTNGKNSDEALLLLDWSLKIRREFSYWPTASPKPTTETNWAVEANEIFDCAICYIIFHEYAHSVNNHKNHYVNNPKTTREVTLNIQLEKEADNFAFEAMINPDDTEEDKYKRGLGILYAELFSLLLIPNIKSLRQSSHINLDDRIIHSLQRINLAKEKWRERHNLVCVFCFHIFFKEYAPSVKFPREEEDSTSMFQWITNQIDKMCASA